MGARKLSGKSRLMKYYDLARCMGNLDHDSFGEKFLRNKTQGRAVKVTTGRLQLCIVDVCKSFQSEQANL